MFAPSDPFMAEILGQPDALRRSGAAARDQQELLSDTAADRFAHIVFTGMGSSLHACHAPVTALAASGVASCAVDTSELLHFRRPALGSHDLVVAVSQSGASAEVVRLVEEPWPGPGRPTVVSVTNGSSNRVAEASDVALDTRVGAEVAPSTMSFAGTLALLALLARHLSGTGAVEAGASVAVDAEEAAVSLERLLSEPDEEAARLGDRLGDRRHVVFLGRGSSMAAAEMSALTVQEAARRSAQAYVTAGFRHGPLEMAGPELAAVFLVGDAGTGRLDLELAREVATTGAAVVIVGPAAGSTPGTTTLEMPELSPDLSPAVSVVPAQLLAWRLALDAGLRPGEFTIATKTTTRE